jgi:hypothetical protein
MDPSQMLIRTAKGQEELRTKAFNLPSHLRRLLIEVDEHSTVGETLAHLAALGEDVQSQDLRSQLDGLLADGFIALQPPAIETGGYSLDDWELVAEEYGTPDDTAPAGVPVHHHAQFNLDKAKGFARFVLLGALGPAAYRRVERIDAAKDVHELRAELDELRERLPHLLSKRQAAEVWEQLEPLMLSVR